MKLTTSLTFFMCYFLAVYALPAKPKDSVEEVEIVPLDQGPYGRQPVVDTGVFSGPFGNPFEGAFDSFAGIVNRMRKQMDSLLKHLHGLNSSDEALSPPPFPPAFPQFDLGKGNTTSVTKIIDGHKVVINETDYKQEGDFGGAFFKVRVIDVLPDSSELTTEKNAEEITSGVNLSNEPESVEESFENEIPKNRESEVITIVENFDDEIDSKKPIGNSFEKLRLASSLRQNPEMMMSNDNVFEDKWNKIEPLESFEDNYLYNDNIKPFDLSRDTFVNEMMADAGAPTNPDAEVFSNSEIVRPPRSNVQN